LRLRGRRKGAEGKRRRGEFDGGTAFTVTLPFSPFLLFSFSVLRL
jgi:hypothetical protein